MFLLMTAVPCPFTGRYLHHARTGRAFTCPKAADKAMQRAIKATPTMPAPYCVNERNVIVKHPGSAAIPAFSMN